MSAINAAEWRLLEGNQIPRIHRVDMAKEQKWRVLDQLPRESLNKGSPGRREGAATRKIFNPDNVATRQYTYISLGPLNRCGMKKITEVVRSENTTRDDETSEWALNAKDIETKAPKTVHRTGIMRTTANHMICEIQRSRPGVKFGKWRSHGVCGGR